MKKLLLSLITLFIFSVAFSQTPFQRIYPCPYGESGSFLIKTRDNGYLIVGNGYNGQTPPHLMKTDEFGNLLWSASLKPDLRAVNDVLQDNDDGCLIIGATALIKLDPLGHILWQYSYSTLNGGMFYKMKKDISGDGYLILAVTSNGFENSFQLLKVNHSGSVAWTQSMNLDYGSAIPSDIVQSSKDSSIYVGSWGIVYNKAAALVSKFDKNGVGFWTKAMLLSNYSMNNPHVTLRETYQGNILVGFDPNNELIFTEVNANGTIVSKIQKLAFPFKCLWFWDLASPGPNNSIVFSALKDPYVQHPFSRHTIVGKVNALGSISWVKELGVKNGECALSLSTNEPSIALLATYYDSTAQKSNLKLIKSDAFDNFCDEHFFAYPSISYSADTSLNRPCKFNYRKTDRTATNFSMQFLHDSSYEACYETTFDNIDLMSIYPNPFNVDVTIAFQEIQYNVVIKIFNNIGKLVQEIPFTGKQLVLPKGGLSNGIYFIQVIGENKKSLTRKLMVQ